MTETFFSKFPIIQYSNTNVVDITKRVKIVNDVQNNPYVYYPYTIENNERPDQLANSYYDDPYLGWIFWLSNNIIDPYHEWYSTEIEFTDFINKKYGSIEASQNIILKYRTKYPSNEEKLSITQYSELAPIEYKYWNPVYENEYKLSHYERKKLKWEVNTNFVIKYTLSSNPTFSKGQKVNITLNNVNFGVGYIISVSNNIVFVNSVSGDVYPHDDIELTNGKMFITGGTQYTISSLQIIKENIDLGESKYWEPLSAFQYELERNEFNKTLRIIDKSYIPQIAIEFRESMKNV